MGHVHISNSANPGTLGFLALSIARRGLLDARRIHARRLQTRFL